MRDADANPYLARSRYATQLERYLDHFPKAMIMMVDTHELRFRRVETLRGIFRFLNVEEAAWRTEMEQEFNSSKRRRRNLAGQGLWGLGRRTLGEPRTRSIMRRAPAWTTVPLTGSLTPTVVDSALRGGLVSMFADEAARLRALTGMRFESWSV